MKPLRTCLDCGTAHRLAGPRCRPCTLEAHKRRNRMRVQYKGSWKRTSIEARRRQPWCSVCGTPYDLTLDHEHGQVECRGCNSSHRRNVS